MTTAEQVGPLDPAAVPTPVSSRLTGPIADSIALSLTTLTLLMLSGMTPIRVGASATALDLLSALIDGGAGVTVTPNVAIQVAIVVLLLIGNIVGDVLLLLAPMPMSSRLVGATALGLALLWAAATFLVLAGLTSIAPVHEVVVNLLLGNAATGLLLLAIIGREVWVVVRARRRGYAGSRLHVQIVGLFVVIAAVPTILVAVVASTTLDRALDRFFSTRTRAMIEQSVIVADAYVSEHFQAIRGEIMAMAFDLGRAKPMFDTDRERFQKFFTAQATARGVSAAMIIRADGSTVERADLKMDKAIVLPSQELLRQISETEPHVALIPQGDHIAAAIKLHGYDDTYLYVARLLDPRVVQQLGAT
jgi:two-component system nitrogen regulation sensor histidine kinase NtrY